MKDLKSLYIIVTNYERDNYEKDPLLGSVLDEYDVRCACTTISEANVIVDELHNEVLDEIIERVLDEFYDKEQDVENHYLSFYKRIKEIESKISISITMADLIKINK